MQIEDGRGSGILASVNNKHRLEVCSVSEPKIYYSNELQQQVYSTVFTVTPVTDGVFFYLKNNSNNVIHLNSIHCYTTDSTSEEILIQSNSSGTPGNTNTITPVNRNVGAGNLAISDSYIGSNITGLTEGSDLYQFIILPNNPGHVLRFQSKFMLEKNRVLTLRAVNGHVTITVNISYYFLLPS